MRSQGAFYADLSHQNGRLFYSASDANWTLAASLVYTRNAGGDYSLNQGASLGPSTITVNLCDVKRLIEVPNAPLPFQEQFGTAAGTAGYPAGAPGMPPFTGTTQLVPPTGMPPKGIRVNSFNYIYQITGAALTLHTVTLYKTTFANNTANVIATPAITGTAQTATQANNYVSLFTVTSPVFDNTDLQDTIVEIQVTTTTSGAYRFYGVLFNVDFNYD